MARIIFAITGASGIRLANACLDFFSQIANLEIHLLISSAAQLVMANEQSLASVANIKQVYDDTDLAAAPASGSWQFEAMIVCPCSGNTLSAVANGRSDTLIQRTCSVALKERRKLVLVLRDTPFSLVHIRNMEQATQAGAIIMPFIPAFYLPDNSMHSTMRQFAGHLLDITGIDNNLRVRWRDEA